MSFSFRKKRGENKELEALLGFTSTPSTEWYLILRQTRVIACAAVESSNLYLHVNKFYRRQGMGSFLLKEVRKEHFQLLVSIDKYNFEGLAFLLKTGAKHYQESLYSYG